jgi:nitrogen regulatory protein P-II 1
MRLFRRSPLQYAVQQLMTGVEMKKMEAIIRHQRLDAVRRALCEAGVLRGMTIAEVRGNGQEERRPGLYRGAIYQSAYVPKLKLEIVAPEDEVPAVIVSIYDAAYTGEVGDGKILVSTVDGAYRIRTGEVCG